MAKTHTSPFLYRLLGNTMVGLSGTSLQKAFTFATGLVLARGLGEEGFGVYSYVVAYMFLFGFLADLGMERIVTREVASRPQEAGRLIGDALILKVVLSIVALIAALAGAHALGVRDDVRYCILLAALGLPLSIEIVFRSYLQMRYQLKYTYAISLPGGLAFLVAAILCVRYELPVYALFYAGLAIGFVAVGSLFAVLRWRLHLRIVLRPHWGAMARLLRDSFEVGLFALLFMLSLRLDQLMLSHLRSVEEVGIYSAAVRMSESLFIIPEALLLTVFPLLVSTQSRPSEHYRQTYRLSFKYLAVIFMPIALVLTLLSQDVTTLLFGASYARGSDALALLVLNMFFSYMGAVYINLFIAQGQQRLLLVVSAVAVAVNIVLNLLWIPSMGATGAAAATLAANAIGFLCWCAIRTTRPYMIACVREAARPLLAGAIAFAAARSLSSEPSLVVGLSLGLYAVLAWAFGGVDWRDVILVRQLYGHESSHEVG